MFVNNRTITMVGLTLALLAASCGSTEDGSTQFLARDNRNPSATFVSPGQQSADEFGELVSMDFTSGLRISILQEGYLAIGGQSGEAVAGRSDLVIFHPQALNDPSQLDTPGLGVATWDAEDFTGWLEAVPPEIVAVAPTQTEISGFPTTLVEFEIPDGLCSPDDDGEEPFCLGFAQTVVPSNEVVEFLRLPGQGWRSDRVRLNSGSRYVVRWIELGGGNPPLVVMYGTPSESETSKLLFGSTVESLAIGEPIVDLGS